MPDAIRKEIKRLAGQYKFFHWHLAFPDVLLPLDASNENVKAGWDGGFDVVLGNPPWERLKIQDKEWFAERAPAIASATTAKKRRVLIENLTHGDAESLAAYRAAKRESEAEGGFAPQVALIHSAAEAISTRTHCLQSEIDLLFLLQGV